MSHRSATESDLFGQRGVRWIGPVRHEPRLPLTNVDVSSGASFNTIVDTVKVVGEPAALERKWWFYPMPPRPQ
jgi:hypothetical protein